MQVSTVKQLINFEIVTFELVIYIYQFIYLYLKEKEKKL